MSQFPDDQDPFAPPLSPMDRGEAGAQSNGMAVASLVCGILLCIPVVAPLLAFIFGAIGLGKTRNPRVGGKGMAIAGIVLGLVNIGIWIVIGLAIAKFGKVGIEMAKMPKEFLTNLSTGNVDAALSICGPGVDRARLQATADELKPLGAFQDMEQPISSSTEQIPGSTASKVTLGFTGRFEKGKKSCTVKMDMDPFGGTVKVIDWTIK